MLFAVETIEGVVPAAPRDPAHPVTRAAGADVDPAAGGEGDGLYPHASVIPKGIAIHAPLSFLTSARMNCLLMAGW